MSTYAIKMKYQNSVHAKTLNKSAGEQGLSFIELKHKREQRKPSAGWFHILH